MNLRSKNFSGIEIVHDGIALLIRKKNNSIYSYIDTVKNEIKLGGNLISNSITLIENDGDGTDKIILKAPILADSYTLTLPTDNGILGNVLSNDGNGNLSWITTSGLSSGASSRSY